MLLFIHFFFDLSLLISDVLLHRFSTKKIKIRKYTSKDYESYFSEIIENCFVFIDKKYPKKIDRSCPEYRSNSVIYPEFLFFHATRSSDKWYKCSCKVMKLSEYNIPKSIFFDLFCEDFLFCFSESDIVTITVDDLVSIPFSDPISDIVTEHGTDARE
jgi:hypothetical protein